MCPQNSFFFSITISSRQITHTSLPPMSELLLWLWSLTISHIEFSHLSNSSWVWAIPTEKIDGGKLSDDSSVALEKLTATTKFLSLAALLFAGLKHVLNNIREHPIFMLWIKQQQDLGLKCYTPFRLISLLISGIFSWIFKLLNSYVSFLLLIDMLFSLCINFFTAWL